MLGCYSSLNHQCGIQYLIRYHDALHPSSTSHQISITKSKVRNILIDSHNQLTTPSKLILCGLFGLGIFVVSGHIEMIEDKKLTEIDPLRCAKQILLLRPSLLPNVDILVHS